MRSIEIESDDGDLAGLSGSEMEWNKPEEVTPVHLGLPSSSDLLSEVYFGRLNSKTLPK